MASPNASTVSLPLLAPKRTETQEKSTPGNPSKPAKAKKGDDEDGTGIEELAMPRTMIARLAKSALPPNTNLQRDALLALSKTATLFISHLASAAQEDLPPSKKTIQPANVFAALEATEFAFMIPSLKADLEKFIAIQANKREEYKKRLKDGKAGLDGSTMLVGDEDSIADGLVQTRGADPAAQLEAESAIDRQRTAKRTKGTGGAAIMAGQEDEDDDIDMLDADAGDEPGDAVEEEEDDEEEDEEATESDNGSEGGTAREDGIGTDPEEEEDEEEAGSEEDSD